jgi:thiosulfate reductase/polysulfide reductase chain A
MVKENFMNIVRSTCGFCYTGCGIRVHVDNNTAVKIEGDPESPVNKGLLCEKALTSLEYLYHPERLRYPLKRKGNRGEGKWQRISWDEALEFISERLGSTKKNSGAESSVFIKGGG